MQKNIYLISTIHQIQSYIIHFVKTTCTRLNKDTFQMDYGSRLPQAQHNLTYKVEQYWQTNRKQHQTLCYHAAAK